MNCPECRADYSETPKCGLRLFHSQNECGICLESCSEMVALPCGHQFCLSDLKRIGLDLARPVKKRKRSGAIRTWRRRSMPRCGWCGQLGHSIRRCDGHQDECGCADRGPAHVALLNGKEHCTRCGKRGHGEQECDVVVLA